MTIKKSSKDQKKAEFTKKDSGYSLFAHRAINAINYYMQRDNLYQNKIFSLPISQLRLLMNLQNAQNYIEIIKQAFLELKKPIELNNFTHPDERYIDGMLPHF